MVEDEFCKPVDQSCIFLLHGRHYQFNEGRGTEVPTIDLGKLLFCKDTCREHVDVEKVESDKDSEGNSMEKMPKKIVRKLVPIENDHKKSELALEAEPFYSKRDGLEGETLQDDLKRELGKLIGDIVGEQKESKPEEEKLEK